jgi:hypothetical protein
MWYSYRCECGKTFDKDYPMGKAAKTVKCSCGKRAHRDYTISVKVPDATNDAREGRGRG